MIKNKWLLKKNNWKTYLKNWSTIKIAFFIQLIKLTACCWIKEEDLHTKKNEVFYKLFNTVEDRNIIYENDENRIPFYTPFVEQKKDIDTPPALYTIDGPLQFFHADVAFLKFFAKSAVDPKYALLCVDLFTSKIYVYTMRKKSNLWQKLELFYKEIDSKHDKKTNKMRLQTDLEFQQNEIKKLNTKYDVEMFSSSIRGGKAFAAEQKIREFKKILFKSKRLHKAMKGKRLDSKKLIRKAVENMNNTNSQKYGFPPETVEKKALSDNIFREIYDFHRMIRVSKDAARYKCYDIWSYKKLYSRRKRLREPLMIGERVLVLAERLKKKDAPGNLFKSTTENIPFFNRNEIFIVRKIIPIDKEHSSYSYWVSKSSEDKIIDKRFLRQELFALKNQFEI